MISASKAGRFLGASGQEFAFAACLVIARGALCRRRVPDVPTRSLEEHHVGRLGARHEPGSGAFSPLFALRVCPVACHALRPSGWDAVCLTHSISSWAPRATQAMEAPYYLSPESAQATYRAPTTSSAGRVERR